MQFHHVGIAVEDIGKAAERYEQAFGLKLEGGIIVDEIQKVRVGFVPTGPASYVEFVEPLSEDSPVTRIVRRGGGMYHICYLVSDLSEAIEQVVQAGGRRVSGPVPAKAFQGRNIAWVYTADRSLVEFLAAVEVSGDGRLA